jgi:hypothetical protein
MLWSLFNFLGTASSIGTAGYELGKKENRKDMNRNLVYVGAGLAALLGLAYIEKRKAAAAAAQATAAVIATAPATSSGGAILSTPSGATVAVSPGVVSTALLNASTG